MKETLQSFRSVIRPRAGKARLWVILFLSSFSLYRVIMSGFEASGFMFYRLRYNLATESMADLTMAYYITAVFSQIVVIPFLSRTLRMRDTSIIILAIIPTIAGFMVEALGTEIWVLFLSWSGFYLLWVNIETTSRSALTKLVEPTEVGKVFTILGLINRVIGLIATPMFGFIYKMTVDVYPASFLFILDGVLCLLLVLIVIILVVVIGVIINH